MRAGWEGITVTVWQGRSTAALAGVAVSLVALAACTETVPGRGDAAATAGPTPPGGSTAVFAPSVTVIESRRLAYAVPRPDVVVSSFTRACLPTLPLQSVDALGGFGGLFVDRSVNVFRRDGFVAGYVRCRSDPANGRGTVAAAIEMADEASANRVAADLVPTLTQPGDTVAPLDGVGEATAVTGLDRTTGRQVLQTIIVFRRLVLYQYTDDRDGRRLVATAVKILRSALARARNYRPTPLEGMSRLRDDPDHLRRLLVRPSGSTSVNDGGYDLNAYYGLAEDPEAERGLLTRAGFTSMYSNQGEHESYSVYALRDPAAARAVLAGFTGIERRLHRDLVTLPVPPAGPRSFCFAFTGDGTPVQRCFFVAARYLYQVDAFGFPATGLRRPGYVSALVVRQKARAPG